MNPALCHAGLHACGWIATLQRAPFKLRAVRTFYRSEISSRELVAQPLEAEMIEHTVTIGAARGRLGKDTRRRACRLFHRRLRLAHRGALRRGRATRRCAPR